MLRTLTATRYVTPLREGGSLPAVVEAEDNGLYVLKFRGAGQGPKALIAELVAGEIGRALGLLVPEIVLMELDPVLGRSEPDFEIQALLKASAGLNLALDFLPGALAYTPAAPASAPLDAALASAIVWFDAYVTNVDRTARNTNLLVWHKRVWPIDHGAALYFHHSWARYAERSRDRFAAIKDHVLLPKASALEEADAVLSARLTPEILRGIVTAIPDGWLDTDAPFADAEEQRAAYVTYLLDRLRPPRPFLEEALHARAQLV
jgi:HipA-like protein